MSIFLLKKAAIVSMFTRYSQYCTLRSQIWIGISSAFVRTDTWPCGILEISYIQDLIGESLVQCPFTAYTEQVIVLQRNHLLV